MFIFPAVVCMPSKPCGHPPDPRGINIHGLLDSIAPEPLHILAAHSSAEVVGREPVPVANAYNGCSGRFSDRLFS